MVKHCKECHETMEVKEEDISPEFNAHHLTKTKSKGKLRFSFWNLFQMLKQVEFYIVDFVRSRGSFNMTPSGIFSARCA